MKDIIEAQNEMIKTLISQQPLIQDEILNDEDYGLEESHMSSLQYEMKPGISHNHTLNNPLGHQITHQNQTDIHRSATRSHQQMDDNDWE
jgi:type IV secretory pathway component VirB8